MSESWVADLETLPSLAAVLRAGLLSRVRVFDVFCDAESHRCVDVLIIDRRPLAPGKQRTQGATVVVGAEGRTFSRHRGRTLGVWLDQAQPRVPVGAECRCGDQLVTAGWLNEQLAAGRRRRVLDTATRQEILERGRDYPPL